MSFNIIYSICLESKWTNESIEIFSSMDELLTYNRLQLIRKYIRNFPKFYNSKSNRLNTGNIINKLNSLGFYNISNFTPKLYKLQIKNSVNDQTISNYTYEITGGFVPYDHDTNNEYVRDKIVLKEFMKYHENKNDWRYIQDPPKSKYFQIELIKK